MGSVCEADGRIVPVMNLSVVVPVYKGETLIEPLVAELNRSLSSFAGEYEIILVNDGSPDRSWEVIQSLAGTSRNVKDVHTVHIHCALPVGLDSA